jgi:hypothetical protein
MARRLRKARREEREPEIRVGALELLVAVRGTKKLPAVVLERNGFTWLEIGPPSHAVVGRRMGVEPIGGNFQVARESG